MSAFLRTRNINGTVLFDSTDQCYIFQSKGVVKLNSPTSNPWQGMCAWLTVTTTADSTYPPMVFIRSLAPTVIASIEHTGNVFKFTIYSTYDYNNEDVEYFIFCTPRIIDNRRLGVFAIWNEITGNKTFDTASKHMVVHSFHYETNLTLNDFSYANSARFIAVDPNRRYAACTTISGGWHDYMSSGGSTVSAVMRYLIGFNANLNNVEGHNTVLTDSFGTQGINYASFQIGIMVIDLTAIGL